MKTTNIKYILTSIIMALSISVFAQDNVDIIVTNDGECLKVYNLDYSSSNFCYYTTKPDCDEIRRINKSEVLIIKLADGTKVDLMTDSESSVKKSTSGDSNLLHQSYSPHTYHAIEDDFTQMKFKPTQGMKGYIGMKKRYLSYRPEMQQDEHLENFILASDSAGSVLHFRLISESERTLAVAKPRSEKQTKQLDNLKIKKIEYDKPEYNIPDYVMIGDVKYSVIEIDPFAFSGKKNIKNVIFPETLRLISPVAFGGCRLERIILPTSLEIVGDMAFYDNFTADFKEIRIPKGIKKIGKDCFRRVGLHLSPREYTEAYISSAPDFITTENCTEFGIDDNAIESYERRNK